MRGGLLGVPVVDHIIFLVQVIVPHQMSDRAGAAYANGLKEMFLAVIEIKRGVYVTLV